MANEYYKNNLIAEVIQFEHNLSLTALQIDSLLINYKKLEKMKLKSKEKDGTELTTKDYNTFQNNAKLRLLEQNNLLNF